MHQKYNCNNSLEIFKIFYICRDFLNKKVRCFYILNWHGSINVHFKLFKKRVWGPINPIGTICIEKGWASGPIPNPRMIEYPRTTSKGRDENYTLKRSKKYLCRIKPCSRIMTISKPLSEVVSRLLNPLR